MKTLLPKQRGNQIAHKIFFSAICHEDGRSKLRHSRVEPSSGREPAAAVAMQEVNGAGADTTGNESFAEGSALPRASPRQRLPLPTTKNDPRQRTFTDGQALGKGGLSAKASFADSLALGKDRLSAKEQRW